jgi:alpha-galactosidase
MPFDEILEAGKPRLISGMSSDTYLPFFNLQGKQGGCVLAVGWTGQWMAEFTQETQRGVRVRSGMAKTRFRLHPGERLRTPRIVMMPWTGDEMIHGHNQFRRLMLNHYVPRRDGKPAEPPIGHPTTTHMVSTGILPSEKNQLPILEKAATLGVELFWMDAYWQPQPWGETLGEWDPRPEDFPDGMRPLSDAAHRLGMKYVQWFLPPAVSASSKLAKEHPDFIHGGAKGGLWKFDEPEAREFMTQYISERIKKWGIDIYREDGSGMPPEESSDDRQGVRQMKYVEGWYRFWSDLIERNPGLTIDNCAGGGNRIDLETCSRAYVLWRTDFEDVQQYAGGQVNWSNMGRTEQVLTGGLSLYFPFHSGVVFDLNPYGFRSSMSAGMVLHRDIQSQDFNTDLCRQGIAEFKEIRPLFQGDLYPLLNLSSRQEDWYAYQLDRPDMGEGCAFFFRRPRSKILMCDITLYNIDLQATYDVSITGETYEHGPWRKMSGRELMKPEVRIDRKATSALIRYRLASGKGQP